MKRRLLSQNFKSGDSIFSSRDSNSADTVKYFLQIFLVSSFELALNNSLLIINKS